MMHIKVIDAPISSGPKGAKKGTSSVMVAGLKNVLIAILNETKMIRKQLQRRFVLAGVVGLLFGASTYGSVSNAQTMTPPIPLKIVINRNTSNLVPFIAADNKLFQKYGLDVEIKVVNSGAESNEILASERADGGTLGLGTAVVSWSNGQKLIPVAKYRDGANVYSIIARKGAGISSIKDLKGKKVAVTKGTDPETAFILALKAHGLSADDVSIINAKWADQAALLDRGDVDAANANEPFGTKILKSLTDKVVLVERLGPYYGNGGLMVIRESVIEQYPVVAERMALTFWEGHQIIRKQPDLANASLKKWLQIDDETAKATLALFGARPLLTKQTVEDLKTNVELLIEGKKIRSRPDVVHFMEKGMAIQKRLSESDDYKKLLTDN